MQEETLEGWRWDKEQKRYGDTVRLVQSHRKVVSRVVIVLKPAITNFWPLESSRNKL